MSPEIHLGKEYSLNSDVWSAGCVIYELLTLRKVFDGSIQFEIMKAVIETEPPKLPTLFGSILNMYVYFNFLKKFYFLSEYTQIRYSLIKLY